MPEHTIDPESSPERRLWCAVLLRAVLDLGLCDAGRQDAAWRWIFRSRIAAGSFEWICLLLGIDPDLARRAVLTYCQRTGGGNRLSRRARAAALPQTTAGTRRPQPTAPLARTDGGKAAGSRRAAGRHGTIHIG